MRLTQVGVEAPPGTSYKSLASTSTASLPPRRRHNRRILRKSLSYRNRGPSIAIRISGVIVLAEALTMIFGGSGPV
jgi:hypothetical protein